MFKWKKNILILFYIYVFKYFDYMAILLRPQAQRQIGHSIIFCQTRY